MNIEYVIGLQSSCIDLEDTMLVYIRNSAYDRIDDYVYLTFDRTIDRWIFKYGKSGYNNKFRLDSENSVMAIYGESTSLSVENRAVDSVFKWVEQKYIETKRYPMSHSIDNNSKLLWIRGSKHDFIELDRDDECIEVMKKLLLPDSIDNYRRVMLREL